MAAPGGVITPIVVPPQANFATRLRGAVSGAFQGWFAPMIPLPPVAPPEVKGRQFDYPTGANLQYIPRGTEPVSFDQLRALADSLPLLRAVIETRKDQIASLEYVMRPKDGGKGKKGKKKVRAEDDPASKRVAAFFNRPDRQYSFAAWQRAIIEEFLVTDAVALYPRKTRGGGLYSIDRIDGATIKPVIGQDGRSPMPPDPAYQQILKGVVGGDFTRDELIYAPRNIRTHRFYGFSPVEQIILTVNIALRRDIFTLEYYNTGSMPDAFGNLPKEWTGDQVKQFQDYFDNLLSGNLADRRKIKFMPGDFKLQETRQSPLKDAYDEWLARVICYAFSVPISPFVNQVNRATGETLKLQSSQEGLQPLKQWLKDLYNTLITEHLGEPTVEFVFDDEDENDPLEQAQTLVALVGAGFINRNEGRDDLGMDAVDGGDEYNVTTGQGLKPITAPEEPEIDPNAPQPMGGGQGKKPPVKGAAQASPMPKGGKPAPKSTAKSLDSLPFTKAAGRRPGPVPFDRPAVAKAVGTLSKRLAKALKATRKSVLKQLADAPLGKAAGDDSDTPPDDPVEREAWAAAKAQKIADGLDFVDLEDLAGDETMADLALDSVAEAVAKIGVDLPEDLVNQVNDAAVAIARDRAAELVGMKVLDDGSIVDNPDAEWAITDSTRDMIRDAIADGLADNIGRDEIIANISNLTGFSDDRAELIAETEIARANSQASLEGYRGAAQAGVTVKKEWLIASDNVCDDCTDNADAGPIDLDEDFPSGDDAPPQHPNCRCSLSPVVYDESADEGDDSEEA